MATHAAKPSQERYPRTRLVVSKLSLLLCTMLLSASGCHWGPLAIRDQELCCPTDIRKRHCWLWGEDAVFRRPCGVTQAYHGHKPTCWRPWQAPTTVWRDEHCGPPAALATVGGPLPASHPVTFTPVEELPPTETPVLAPPPSTPAPANGGQDPPPESRVVEPLPAVPAGVDEFGAAPPPAAPSKAAKLVALPPTHRVNRQLFDQPLAPVSMPHDQPAPQRPGLAEDLKNLGFEIAH